MEAASKAGILRRLRKSGWQVLAAPFLLFITLPLAALFLRLTPADISGSLRDAQVVQAVTLSLQTSLVTVLVTLLAGTPVAYLIYRRRTPLYRFLDILIDLPTVLPPAVAGVALLMACGRQGLVGSWLAALGISLPFTPAAVVLAQTFVAAPLYIRSAALGFSGVDCELKKAAALDGASRVQTFRFIMLPIAWHSLLSGIVMTWARALGEFGATIIFAGNFPGRTQTMPLAIYIGFELDLKVALTLSALLIGTSFLILAVVKNYLNNHLEAQNPVD